MDSRGPTQPSIDDPMFEGTEIDGRYVVEQRIGQGGMGAVFRARQPKLDRDVVIKVLRTDVDGEGKWAARFLREAKAASAVQHQNIVEIIDFGELPGGQPYLVMESLQGEDLAGLLTREQRLSWSRTRGILLQVVAALDAAHERGVLHRDIKPSNCFLVADRAGPQGDFVKLLDFGIATFLEPSRISRRLTDQSMVIGTTTYLAPEVAGGGSASVASDIYATGVLAYKMLTGRVPFFSRDPFEVLERVRTEEILPLRSREPSVPPPVEALVLRALARNPESRFANMADFEAAIRMLNASGRPAASGRTGTVLPDESAARGPAPTESRLPPSRSPAKKTLLAEHAPAPPPVAAPTHRPANRRSPVVPILAAAAIIGTVGAALYWWTQRPAPTEPEPEPPPEVHSVAAAVDRAPPDVGDREESPIEPLPDAPGEPAGLHDVASAQPDLGSDTEQPAPPARAKRTRGRRGGISLKDPFSRLGAARPKRGDTETDAEAEARIKRSVSRACAAAGTGVVPVKFSVGSSGKISLVRLQRADKSTPLGDCVSAQLRKQRYPPGELRASNFEVTVP